MRHKDLIKKEKILRSAIEMFAYKGYHNTTIKDISKKARMGDGSIYVYFKSKEKILRAIFKKGWGELLQKIKPITQSDKAPWEKFDSVLCTTLKYFKENIPLARVLIRESIPSKGGLRKKTIIREWFEFKNIADTIFREAQSQGLINEAYNTNVLQHLILGAGEMAIYGWTLGSYTKYKAGYSIENVRKIIMAMLRGLNIPPSKPRTRERIFYKTIRTGIEGI